MGSVTVTSFGLPEHCCDSFIIIADLHNIFLNLLYTHNQAQKPKRTAILGAFCWCTEAKIDEPV